MSAASGLMPIFKTSVLSHSGVQPTESDGKFMGFRPFLPHFRGLDTNSRPVCENEQSRVCACAFSRKALIPVLRTMLFIDYTRTFVLCYI